MAWHSVLIYIWPQLMNEKSLTYKGTQNDRARNLQSDKSSHMQQSNLLIDMLLLLLDKY